LIKNSQPFGKNFQKTLGGIFLDSHCIYFVHGLLSSYTVYHWLLHAQVWTTVYCYCTPKRSKRQSSKSNYAKDLPNIVCIPEGW